MLKMIKNGSLLLVAGISLSVCASASQRTYEIWENEPAPNGGSDWDTVKAGGVPFDQDWEEWSYPIGNGYMGANLFGRVDTERIQITEKTLHNKGIYSGGGLTSFAEVYLDFNHENVTNYRRSLNLNEAIAQVSYEMDGVNYTREYFMSYPDNILAIKVSANKKGALSFVVRPEIPYLNKEDKRTGQVVAKKNLLTLSGNLPFFNINYEGQVKVLNQGGSLKAGKGTITVSNADSVMLLVATGTNYRPGTHIFSSANNEKLDANLFPHEAVSTLIANAQAKGFAGLKKTHLEDYQNLFGRVAINLNSTVSSDPTHVLLEKYKAGEKNAYLEELMFQYGRYLLVASSREKSLPSNLQGVWSQYHKTPWTGGYWHNINVQMNYWGACSANLAECFEAYIEYFKAYLPKAQEHARDFVEKRNPARLAEGEGENGWIIGTSANGYNISGAGGGHSGPGTGGFTSKLLMEYYLFTQDKEFLEEVGYPAMLGMSKFFSKALVPHGDLLLLVEPSASPEQKVRKLEQLDKIKNPGHVDKKGNYTTVGCTFDQGFVWENYNDTLIMADALGKKDDFLKTIRKEITKLDPILIGTSGQIKEYREEQAYSDIGDPKHRHISHLCSLYPGSLINSDQPEWMDAARTTLDFRGNETTGWAMAHRMNCRARLKQGEEALEVYQKFISERTVPNLWTLHPPFQIDGNFGTMAGVAEMLLQSHEEYIDILPALPKAWSTGSFDGLVARGNFVVSAKWKEGKASAISITSRSGGECRLAYPGIEAARVKDSNGKVVKTTRDGKGRINFSSTKGETYTVAF
ncbi:glycoside hydrolase family 95 protein [Pontiellaceae bacterium B12227]|nr:glycoside hydrolase family 95 protein [Pontiellaceae bacterium B12227]